MKKSMSGVMVLVILGLSVIPAVVEAVDVSGKTYIQYRTDLTENKEGDDAFSVERTYLTFKEKFADKADFKVTLDLKSMPTGKSTADVTDSDGKGQTVLTKDKNNYYILFVKYAYITFKEVGQLGSIRIGQFGRPWVGFEENIWEHRWVSKVFSDIEGLLSSTGRGINVFGKKLDNKLEYSVALINGAGYHTQESGSYSKDVEVRLSYELDDGLKINADYYGGRSDSGGVKDRVVGLLSYQGDKLTLAGEYLTANDSGTHGAGYGGFLLVKLGKFTPFARYELYDPDDEEKDDNHSRMIVGVSHKYTDNIDVALDCQLVDFSASDITDTSIVYAHFRVKY